jgi:hypothetical protein
VALMVSRAICSKERWGWEGGGEEVLLGAFDFFVFRKAFILLVLMVRPEIE